MRKEHSTPKCVKNKGRFRKGHDARRHEFTAEERSRGFFTAIAVWGIGIGEKLHASGRWPGYMGKGVRS